ncbi:cellulose-binding domain-containing protein [Vibrio gazogenes]|uniref:Cellulose-binding domain-containing protein n=1 Tax=Vibrio gazogenes DSM 21264 = NBRC 103151 TaxID=1123492 RepID=A0A1M5EN88_VIBGA|nr:cellulose-binding domain-containing protein [Vibrio gazogenes]USP12575.1 hypothetical protein MKS89_08905 [Vibrio gazogenes]SHF80675.1 Cellulose-binding domain-containing protein [Vibrio gazogenes DSM 21264] [Vibrio gazogenes DSM 21264 = NBRC 103151]SJN54082.1 Endoglucanase Z precursor [Vibrio gazogenes]
MIKKRFSALCGALLLFCTSVYAQNETLTVDMSDPIGPVTHAASGALYGITDSLPTDINGDVAPLHPRMYTQPARSGAGYQQPIGAAIPVSKRLANTTAEVTVRLADLLPGWPYQWSGWSHWSARVRSVIADKRASGRDNYYGYEIFNEPNITWDDDANGNFKSSLWKPTYDLIRSQDPGERIIGPSAAWYHASYIQAFLEYCVANNCLPDVISWHELGGSDNITANIADYRARERALGISPRPISINEYSHDTHKYEGAPGVSVPFIAKFERNRVESANISWWFTNLPGRLGSLLTANNQRGGGWWLYKWYGDMTGNMLNVTPPHQNGDGLDGFANLDTQSGSASICLGGNFTGTANVVFNNIPASFGDTVDVTVEYVTWANKDTPVAGPVTAMQSVETVFNGSLTVPVDVFNPLYGYRVTINGQGFGSEGSSAQVELESLSSQERFAPFSVLSDAGAQYIVWPNNGDQFLNSASDDASGQVLIPFSLSQSTAIQLQIRANLPNANDDSFYFKLDDGNWMVQNNKQTSGWNTFTLGTFDNLAAGNHTLRIERREDGAKLDFITLLTAAGDIEIGASDNPPGNSCNGINVYPNWPASDWPGSGYNHANAGDQMVYQNTLYQANWYTNSVPGSDASWTLIGDCD